MPYKRPTLYEGTDVAEPQDIAHPDTVNRMSDFIQNKNSTVTAVTSVLTSLTCVMTHPRTRLTLLIATCINVKAMKRCTANRALHQDMQVDLLHSNPMQMLPVMLAVVLECQ